MKQELSITDDGCLSRSGPLRAIVEWDPGRPDSPIVYPLGGTAERDEHIRATLQQAFTGLVADDAGVQDERPAA